MVAIIHGDFYSVFYCVNRWGWQYVEENTPQLRL